MQVVGDSFVGGLITMSQNIAGITTTTGLPANGSLTDTADQLRTAWELVLGSDDGGRISRPTHLSRRWNLEQTLCIRLFQAFNQQQPHALLARLPAISGLRTLAAAARTAKVAEEHVRQFEAAVDSLDAVIEGIGGSKSDLDTILSRHVDHSRARIEHTAKQQIFRGMSKLFGARAAASVVSVFIFPSADPEFCDELAVHGFHKLIRLRPELPLLLGVRETMHPDNELDQVVLQTLRGDEIPDNGYATALDSFTTIDLQNIELRNEHGRLLYVLKPQHDELPTERDLFFASIERRSEPRVVREGHLRARSAFVANTPSADVLFDVYVHNDLWKQVEPEFVMLRTGNPAIPDLSAHSLDRLDLVESMQRLEATPSAIANNVYPKHAAMLRHVYSQMNWSDDAFRVYRCAIRYPVVGLWYSIQFALPT